MRKYLITAACLLVSCGSLQPSSPAAVSMLGVGKIVSVGAITGKTGESKIENFAVVTVFSGLGAGLVNAGSSEKDFGQSSLFQYDLLMANGERTTVKSFSVLAISDCVEIKKIAGKDEMVLERIGTNFCNH